MVRMNPEYEFLFNALLSRARTFDPKHNDSSKLINEIKKMLKDEISSVYTTRPGRSLPLWSVRSRAPACPAAPSHAQRQGRSVWSNEKVLVK